MGGRCLGWMRAPVLKIVEGADNKQRLVVGKAVELLNVSLPDSLNIVIAADQVAPGKYGISRRSRRSDMG